MDSNRSCSKLWKGLFKNGVSLFKKISLVSLTNMLHYLNIHHGEPRKEQHGGIDQAMPTMLFNKDFKTPAF
jgi:hypothetical protein